MIQNKITVIVKTMLIILSNLHNYFNIHILLTIRVILKRYAIGEQNYDVSIE